MLGAYDNGSLLFITPLTHLHVGVGRGGGTVDLPIQRDPLGFPTIYASSLKGAVKTHAFIIDPRKAKLLFGPEPGDDERYSSPVSFTDAHLLMMPVRSAKASPVFVTSPLMARRVLDLMDLIGNRAELEDLGSFLDLVEKKEIGEGEAVVLRDDPVINAGGNQVFLAGDRFSVIDRADIEFPNVLRKASIRAFSKVIDRVVILNDEDVLRIIKRSLIKLTRIRVDRTTKVVRSGGLWTEEYLPHGSMMVSCVLTSKLRYASAKNGEEQENIDLLEEFRSAVGLENGSGYLVLGGKESVGKGIVKLLLAG